jgi:tRNA pseudouridine55 synthase
VLLLDKPGGISSNAALQRARRLFAAAKAGHAGTLDPLASGLLPVCFGEATKFAQYLLDAPKRYVATIRFGAATTTGDAEGEVTLQGPLVRDEAPLRDILARFTGPRMQQPPRHAALKHEGRAYYDYARRGIEIPRKPRPIEIVSLALVTLEPPHAVVAVECSKGTYVRVLAEEIGEALGTRAHLAALRRVGTGGFDVRDAVSLTVLETLADDERSARLLPVDALLPALPRLVLDEANARALRAGQRPQHPAAEGRYRAYDPDGRFAGLVQACPPRLRALRMMQARDIESEGMDAKRPATP